MAEKRYDVVVLGSGPAGLQAAMRAGRRKVSVLVLGKVPKSSTYSTHIENFCYVHGSTGIDLSEKITSTQVPDKMTDKQFAAKVREYFRAGL